MQNAAITLRSLGSAFDDNTGKRAISHWLSSLLVEGCPCGADLSSTFGAPLLQGGCSTGMQKRNLQKKSVKPQIQEYRFPRTKSLPRMGKVASEARRIGYWRYENKREKRLKKAMWRAGDTRIQCPSKRVQKKRSPCGLRFLISKTTH